MGFALSLPNARRDPRRDHPQSRRIRASHPYQGFRERGQACAGRGGVVAHRRHHERPQVGELRWLHFHRMGSALGRGERPQHHLPPLHQLHEPFRDGAFPYPALRQQRPHWQVRLEEGDAHRKDLLAGARHHGARVPRPSRLQIHHAGLHSNLFRVSGRCGSVCPFADCNGRTAR